MKNFNPLYKIFPLLAAVLLFSTALQAQTGQQYVTKMHQQHANNWYRTLSFTQDTEIYKNDSLLRKSVWYEWARFPYELRIDVDSVNSGNKTIYKKDSTYRIRKHKIQTVSVDPNPFVFFLGGMYMLPLDTVLSSLTANGYDLSLASQTTWQGRKTFIIGAGSSNDLSRNQFWVDAEDLYIVRIVLKAGPVSLDVHLSNHVKLSKGWSETLVKFYRDGKLLQVEHYRNLQPDAAMSDDIFAVEKYR
ncbi:MAG: hypothetical protein EOP47_19965 [Sphingobacteriaceae bacterium]|nr:MAG: hypothetical protein EOP47_19965 [Sphingobacteriaceae bacterium]